MSHTHTPDLSATEIPPVEGNYALHILYIKLWEWVGIQEHWEKEMFKHGPFQEGAEASDTASVRIAELKAAIYVLSLNPAKLK